LNLYMRNIPGLRPGITSKGTIGANFNVALAENEDACEELGWLPMSADTRGFRQGRNVVTVMSTVSVTGPTYSNGDRAIDHLEYLAEFIGESTSTYWSAQTGLMWGKWSPLFVISPRIAGVIARDGYSKKDVREFFHNRCKIPARVIDPDGTRLRGYVEEGRYTKGYWESDDPNRRVPTFMKPEWIQIVLAGDPARNQARGYMTNNHQGFPVSREINLPPDWQQHLQEEARERR